MHQTEMQWVFIHFPKSLPFMIPLWFNTVLAKCENNYYSLSRGHKGHHWVIWGLRTQPGSSLWMSIRLTIAHLFGNCRKCNLQTIQGQSPLSRNVQAAARCRKRLPDTQSERMWQRSMWMKVTLTFVTFEGQWWCHFVAGPLIVGYNCFGWFNYALLILIPC